MTRQVQWTAAIVEQAALPAPKEPAYSWQLEKRLQRL